MQYPGILPAEHSPAYSSGLCWCSLSRKQARRPPCSLRAGGKLIKDKEDVYSFPQSEMCKKNVSSVFVPIQLLLCKLFVQCNLWTQTMRLTSRVQENWRNACAGGGDKREDKSYRDVCLHNVVVAHFRILLIKFWISVPLITFSVYHRSKILSSNGPGLFCIHLCACDVMISFLFSQKYVESCHY